MKFGTEAVRKLRGMGFGHVCSVCSRLHEALESGATWCGQECSGPIGGGAFPMYAGPLTRDMIGRKCFACGENANKLLSTPTGFVGACNAHLRWVSLSDASSDPGEAKVPVT